MVDIDFADFDLVIFDWAGTMVDFGSRAPVNALVTAFSQRGVALEEEVARADMGKAKRDHVMAILARPEILERWTTAHGAAPGEADIDAMMLALGPLMTQAAGEAAELIPGAVQTVQALRAKGLKIGSSTGYTREMMAPVLERAAEQGYAPDHLVCAGETPQGRPSPLMIYKACAELGIWPLSRVIKVDDTEAGVEEGVAAGCFTIGVAASGNAVGLSLEGLAALAPAERADRVGAAGARLRAAGAHLVIDSVADLRAAAEA